MEELELRQMLAGDSVVGLSAAEVERLAGDANSDGAVTFTDFLVLSNSFGNTHGQSWHDGDFDGDAAVTMADFLIIAANFGTVLPRQ